MDGRSRVANNLRRLRIERGLSQENLAVDAAVDRTYVSGIEREEFNPSLDILERLAEALAVDVVDLLAPVVDPPATPTRLKRRRKPR